MGCCREAPAITNITISSYLVQNMQLALSWQQIWLDATSTVSVAYYAIPDTYSTDAGDAGDEIHQREQALCIAVQGWLNEVMNYMESWVIANYAEVGLVAGSSFTGAIAISGLLMFPVLIGWAVAANIAIDAFLELRSSEYREYLFCRMFENLKGKNPDLRSDFNEALTADLIGRPEPQTATQDIARDIIEAYIRSQLNNLDNYLMFAGQLGTAMDIALSSDIECSCTEWAHTFDFTIDEQGFSAYEGSPPGDRALYDAGVGWGNFSAGGPWSHLIQLNAPAFASRLITSLTFFISIPLVGSGKEFKLRMPTVAGADFSGDINPIDETEATMTVDATSDGWWVGVGVDDFQSYQGHIVKLIIRGTGTDPF